MSAAEIADNKWELQATKPPVSSFTGVSQIILMVGFTGLFVWMLGFSVMGIVLPKQEGLAESYSKMGVEGSDAQEAAPSE